MSGEADRVRRAVVLLAVSATLFGLMAFAAKLASARISGAQIVVVRFVVCLLPFVVAPRLLRRALTWQRLDLLLYRGLFGGSSVLLYFLAIAHIPVGVASLLNYSAPVWSGLFAALLLGEALRPRFVLALAVALAGVLCVVAGQDAPGAILGFGLWEAAGFASGVLSGAALTAIRMARRTEGSWSIYLSFTIFGLLAAAPLAVVRWQAPSAREWVLLLAVGLCSMAAQLLMTHAYRWVETMRAGVVAQLAVVVTMALGVGVLGERPGLLGWVGTALTLAGVATAIRAEHPIPADS